MGLVGGWPFVPSKIFLRCNPAKSLAKRAILERVLHVKDFRQNPGNQVKYPIFLTSAQTAARTP